MTLSDLITYQWLIEYSGKEGQVSGSKEMGKITFCWFSFKEKIENYYNMCYLILMFSFDVILNPDQILGHKEMGKIRLYGFSFRKINYYAIYQFLLKFNSNWEEKNAWQIIEAHF